MKMGRVKREDGEGTAIRQDPRGYWYCLVTVNGRRQTIKRKNRDEVARLRLAATNQFADNPQVYVSKKDVEKTVEDYLRWWLAHVVNYPNCSRATARYYRQNVERIVPHIGSVRIKKLTSSHVRAMLSSAKKEDGSDLSPRSVEAILATIKAALNCAAAETPPLITKNPAIGIKPPKKAPKRRVVTVSRAAFDAVNSAGQSSQYGPIISFLIGTGCRIKEALGLQWEYVHLDAENPHVEIKFGLDWLPAPVDENGKRIALAKWELVDVKKDRSRRMIPLNDLSRSALELARTRQESDRKEYEEHGEPVDTNDLVFTTGSGRPMMARNVQRALSAFLKSVGHEHVGLHGLRRTYATELRRRGGALEVIQRLLGHTDIRTTIMYLQEVDEELVATAKLLNDS